MTSWEIRPYSEEDRDAALELAARGLGPGSVPRAASFWEWKHHRNPFGASLGLVAEENGRMLGLRLFLRWRFEHAGSVHSAVRAVDTVTAPEARGKGLFRRLTTDLVERLDDGYAFVFNTPNEASRSGYLTMGWRDVGRVPIRVRPVRPMALFSRARRDRRDTSEPAEGGGGLWGRLAKLAEQHFADDPRWRTARSESYFRWRYGEAPGLDYSVHFAPADEAAIVWRRRRRGRWMEGSISEAFVGGPENLDALSLLLRSGWRKRGVDYVVASAACESMESAALSRARFIRVPRVGPRLTVRRLASAAPTRWPEWRLGAGDLEVF